MTIYVQSRGKSQEHDHCWLKITKDAPPSRMTPLELEKIEPEELIDSQKPSIILARSGNHLVLLIMALETGDGRTDFMGRQIRNSVAWVEVNSPENDWLLRKIAIQALNGDLAKAIDNAVYSDADSDYGFTAKFAELAKIGTPAELPASNSIEFKSEPNAEKANFHKLKFARDNEDRRSDLIQDLQQYALSELPANIQIVVVVTTMKSSDGLRKKGVWRGLSSRIESKDWECYGEEVDLQDDKKKLLFVIVIVILVSVITMIIWALVNHSTPRNLKPKSINPVHPSEMQTASQIPHEPLPQ
jgi:hypothetical protein